jgi:4-hydroxy-4-methyl-2-oxoglutarate aldolase
MQHKIIRNIQRANAEVIESLGEQGVATIHEAQGRIGLLNPYMRPIYSSAKVAGSAVTVSCQPGDNLMIHAAVEVCQPGDVLVVTTTSESTDGMFGDLLATSCQAQGIRGLIIDAGIRDVADLTTMNFPVWAKAISSQGTVKATPGSVNVDVVCAGAIIRPGDVVVGDIDGVVVIKREDAETVAALGYKRLEKEAQSRAKLAAGEFGIEFYGLRSKLKELGVEYVDE